MDDRVRDGSLRRPPLPSGEQSDCDMASEWITLWVAHGAARLTLILAEHREIHLDTSTARWLRDVVAAWLDASRSES